MDFHGQFFSYRILFLYLFCFSIYAALSRVKDVRKLEHPIFFIFFSLLMATLTFGFPIATYLFKSNIKSIKLYVYDARQLEEMKQNATNIKTAAFERYHSAETYFLSTGESIPYLTDENKKAFYNASEQVKKLRENIVESNNLSDWLERKINRNKIKAYALVSMLISFLGAFVIFLRYKFSDS